MQRLKQGEAADSQPTAADELLQTRRRRSRPTTSPRASASRSRASTRSCSAWPSAAARYPATRSLATSRSGEGSPSTARTVQRGRAQARSRALHRRQLGRRRRDLLPSRDPGRRLGSPPPARGHVAHLRRGRDQHPRRALHGEPPDGQEPVRGRGGGHSRAGPDDQPLRNIDAVFDAYRVTPGAG